MTDEQCLLEWCKRDRDISQGIVDDIGKGARHYCGPVGGVRSDFTAALRARESAIVTYLNDFIAQLVDATV